MNRLLSEKQFISLSFLEVELNIFFLNSKRLKLKLLSFFVSESLNIDDFISVKIFFGSFKL